MCMKIINAEPPAFKMEHGGVVFNVVCTGDFIDVVDGYNNLAASTNTHPEVLLDLIDEEIYKFEKEAGN